MPYSDRADAWLDRLGIPSRLVAARGLRECREAETLEIAFEDTAAFRWLRSNADRFGFRMSYPRGNAGGYQYEPWHWCYRPAATDPGATAGSRSLG